MPRIESGVQQQSRHADHAIERGPDLVTHRAQEFGLGEIRLFRFAGLFGQHCLSVLLLGDIIVGRNPAAVRHRRSANKDHTTVGEREGLGGQYRHSPGMFLDR